MSIGQMTKAEIQQYNGRPVVVQRDGGLRDAETGKILRGVPPEATRITTSERARELNHIRWHGEGQRAYLESLQEAMRERGESKIAETIEQAAGDTLKILQREITFNPDARGDWRIKADQHAREQSGIDGRAPKQAAQALPSADTGGVDAGKLAAVVDVLFDELQRRGMVE